jgi:hypothetical protein
MFSYSPQTQDNSGAILAQGQVGSAQTQAEMYNRIGSDIGGALASIGSMYGKAKDKKDMLAGMDKAVGAMSDFGALPKGFINNYNQLDDNVRPFIFQALASPMFEAYQKKQGYMDYATAMRGVYGNRGGGMPAPGVLEQF